MKSLFLDSPLAAFGECSFRLILFIGSILICFISRDNLNAQQLKPLARILEKDGYTVGSGEALGRGLAVHPDIDGDGYPDILVASYRTRKLQVYFTGPGILDDQPDVMLEGGGESAIGDLNGDGYPDIVSVKPKATDRPDHDTIFVYLGMPGPGLRIDTIPALRIPGEREPDEFGRKIIIADFDQNGYDDLVVFAGGNDKAYIYMGKEQLSVTPDFMGQSNIQFEHYRNIYHGDINGDSYPDLLVASFYDRPPDDYQLIDVYNGKPNWTFEAGKYNQRIDSRSEFFRNNLLRFEFIACSVVDINRDGFDDLYIRFSTTPNKADTAAVFFGSTDSIRTTPGKILSNPDTSVWVWFMPYGAFNIHDINNNGYSDYAIRMSPGGAAAALIYPGNSKGITDKPMRIAFRSSGDNGDFARHLIGGFDFNGDSINDFVCTAGAGAFGIPNGYFGIFSGDTTMLVNVETSIDIPSEFHITSVFPNPSSSYVSMAFSLPKPADIRIAIVDVLGRVVHQVFTNPMSAGNHTFRWDGVNLAGEHIETGFYIFTLHAYGIALKQPFIILR